MNGKCCVFQPFDKGPYDKRYDETIEPAIKEGGLEPYRVDRDHGVVIPVDTLHEEIRSSTLCFADISDRNPNVMYELGYALASNRDVVLICSRKQGPPFPFDIQHRGVILYDSDSASDFTELKRAIIAKIRALVRKNEVKQDIASGSPLKSTEGLQPSEIAALAFIMANRASVAEGVSPFTIKADMEQARYNALGAQIALTSLSRLGMIEAVEEGDYHGNPIFVYRLLPKGEDWLLANQDKLELRLPEVPTARPATKRVMRAGGRPSMVPYDDVISDDDVPF